MPLPKEVTQLMGTVDTADRTTTTIDPFQPFEIGQDVWRYNPYEHSLLTYVMQNAQNTPTSQSRFGHPEKSHLPFFVQYTGDDESSQATTDLTFTDGGKRLSKYSKIRVLRTGENILFQANFDSDGTTSGDVDRNFGTSGTPLLQNGDICLILGKNKPEGAFMGKDNSQLGVYKSFRTRIFEKVVSFTGTKAAERTIEGDPFTLDLTDKWDQFNHELEASILFDAEVDDDSTYDYPMHSAVGLESFIETNVFALDGVLTLMDFWDIIAEWRKRYKGPAALVTSGEIIQLINTIAWSRAQYDQSASSIGMDIDTIKVPGHGSYTLIDCDLLGADSSLAGYIFGIPAANIKYRPLIGNGENRDIHYSPIDRAGYDLKEGHIFGEVGWEYMGEETFLMVSGIEF